MSSADQKSSPRMMKEMGILSSFSTRVFAQESCAYLEIRLVPPK
jgi:hypothetical protein